MSEDYVGRQYVGMDLHRRRSVLVRMTEAGERLETVRIVNDRELLAKVMARAGEDPEVVLEATYGWYWAVDALAELGGCVHLAHPLGVKGFSYRRVKNDERDAYDLADLLRMGRLPEAWIAPPKVRELRELVRHRAKLVHLRTSLRCQVHAVLANHGVGVPVSDLFGVQGSILLERAALSPAARVRVDSLLRLIDSFDTEIDQVAKTTARQLASHPGYTAVQTLPGVGPILAAVFVTEIGDITRFPAPAKLASWAGLTPRHYESDTTVHRGRISKQGSRLVRWAAVEAVQRVGKHTRVGGYRDRVAARRGRNIGNVAAARELIEYVYYALRDGTCPDVPSPPPRHEPPEQRAGRRSICCLTPGLGWSARTAAGRRSRLCLTPSPTGVVAHLNDLTRPPPVEHLHAAPRGVGMTDSHHRCPHAE